MKSLGEIYWDIDHECLHSDKTTSFSDETMMLFHAAEEYVEELRKHDEWKSIVLHDIDYLKASSFIRREQKGYSEGAEVFLGFIYEELERYGLKIDNDDYPDIPDELKNLFPNESQCIDFVRRNYGKAAEFVAHAYLDEHGVINPSDANNSIPVRAILFRFFVEPIIKGKKEKESARTGFYKYFQFK